MSEPALAFLRDFSLPGTSPEDQPEMMRAAREAFEHVWELCGRDARTGASVSIDFLREKGEITQEDAERLHRATDLVFEAQGDKTGSAREEALAIFNNLTEDPDASELATGLASSFTVQKLSTGGKIGAVLGGAVGAVIGNAIGGKLGATVGAIIGMAIVAWADEACGDE